MQLCTAWIFVIISFFSRIRLKITHRSELEASCKAEQATAGQLVMKFGQDTAAVAMKVAWRTTPAQLSPGSIRAKTIIRSIFEHVCDGACRSFPKKAYAAKRSRKVIQQLHSSECNNGVENETATVCIGQNKRLAQQGNGVGHCC